MFEKFKVSKAVYEELQELLGMYDEEDEDCVVYYITIDSLISLQEEVINAVANYNYERYYLSMFLESITYKINRVLGYKY
jgi:hypothetical protein|nr:MAG TPA: hypothetical protein [Caudoviricetes sp.]